jgi:cell division protein FtsZ
MALKLDLPVSESQLTPKITVIGVGGAGGNAVNNMIQANLEGVDFLVANTDSQALNLSLCEHTVQIGRHITQGLGAGSQPEVGRAAAEEAMDEILAALEGVNMVFIAAGMGGGTGTGAAPVIARATREAGILTVGVCTKPFQFEGIHRMQIAEAGLTDLQEYADTLIIIPNQNLFRVANEKTTFADAFKMADDVLHAGVRGVTDLIVMPGLINLDFADIRAVMSEMGKAMMGTGEADSERRSIEAAEAAISNPLLDEVSMKGARGVLINITGGDDLTLFEVDEAANRIRDEVDPDANIIFGSTFEQEMSGRMRVSVVATGIDTEAAAHPRPVSLSLVSSAARAARASGGPATGAITAEGAELTGEALVEELAEEAAEEVAYASADPVPMAPEEIEAKLAEEPLPEAGEPESDSGLEFPEPAEDSFIAPPAAEVQAQPAPQTAAQADYADPFAAAELANSGQRRVPAPADEADTAAPRKAQGLLAKVTGAARAFHEATQSTGEPEQERRAPRAEAASPARARQTAQPRQAPAPRRAAPAPAQADGAPVAAPVKQAAAAGQPAAPAPAPAGQRPAAAKTEPAVNQPRLTGLDPAERVGVSQSEEDLLDIPAFLRRQAN